MNGDEQTDLKELSPVITVGWHVPAERGESAFPGVKNIRNCWGNLTFRWLTGGEDGQWAASNNGVRLGKASESPRGRWQLKSAQG